MIRLCVSCLELYPIAVDNVGLDFCPLQTQLIRLPVASANIKLR